MNFNKRYRRSYQLWEQQQSLILNGVMTLSKSPVSIGQGGCPVFVERAKGAYFWDVDGNKYLDFPMALGPILLGYACEPVDSAVREQIGKGVLYSLSSPLESELARLLQSLVPCAEKVRFLKSGSEAASAAVRIARAYTGRDIVLSCGYHGWHDWTAVRTSRRAGIPDCNRGLIKEFVYNDLDSLDRLLTEHRGGVAAVILEPVGMYAPAAGFLAEVRELTRKHDALLIFDEVITGFRLAAGGAQAYFRVTPDLAIFGKAMANGYPISAVVGSRKILDRVEDHVFISSTYGGDLTSIAAAIATLDVLRTEPVTSHLMEMGSQLKGGLTAAIAGSGLPFSCEGMPHKTFIVFREANGIPAVQLETAFRHQCFARGMFLGYGHFTSFAHSREDVAAAVQTGAEVFQLIADAVRGGSVMPLLLGEVAHAVFKRY